MLAEAIRHTATLPGGVGMGALHAHLMKWTGLPEEECGGDIIATMFFMSRCGLYTSNTPNILAGETRLCPSRALTLHLFDEGGGEPDISEIS